MPRKSGRTRTACFPTGTEARTASSGAALAIGVGTGAGAGAADAARVIWAERGVAPGGTVSPGGTVRIRGAAASIAVAAVVVIVAAFVVGAVVLCAAYCAADDATDDKDNDDDDRRHPPFRAIPRPFRDCARPGTVLQVPFFVREGDGARAVAICEWLLVRRLAFWNWRGGCAAIAAFV